MGNNGFRAQTADAAGRGAVRPAPVLTIAVPSYNVEAYLERGLASYDDDRLEGGLEVIVVDDGSTDGTCALAQRYAARRPAVFRIISKTNGGHGSAVNAGLAAARGRYFRVVDGDDWVSTDGLAALIDELRELDADLVVDRKREVDMVTGEQTPFPLAAGVDTGTVLPFESVLTNGDTVFQIMIHTLTARTGYLRGLGIRLLEHTFYEDYEYVVKASAPAATIAYLDIEVYQYLVGNANQSVSHANYVRRWGDHGRVVGELLRYLDAAEAGGVAGGLSEAAIAYLREKVHLIVDTHYNIALLFDTDRRRGRERARAFRRELRMRNPDQWRRGERRYRTALALNMLGISYDRIQGLMAGRRR
ncbi:MAG: glycosyltransferase family 2 protein [Coriobacteriaceae bacterium]|nr:glycosyltransferase family 2 protein [Coriobacteriaceae bacterium]